MRMNKNKCFLCILKEPILIWPLDLTEIIKTCFMLGCYTAIFNITAETLGPQSTGKFFPKNQSCALVLKKIQAHIGLLQRYQVKLHFLLKNNNFLLMNPLLAAIDLHEALPRVIHDHDKKIHCRIQTEILLHRVVWIAKISHFVWLEIWCWLLNKVTKINHDLSETYLDKDTFTLNATNS